MAEATGPGGNGQGGSGEAVTARTGSTGAGGQFLAQREVMIVLPGLLLAILLAMLDNLIVSTALPRIVGDLGGVAHLSWVVTAYILASLVVTPFYGKLGDMYGRKKFFIVAILIFLAGSALSGLSQSMAELITFRAIQGLGAGGLMVGAMATLGDIVAPRERGRYMSYMMVVMMLATIGGPLVGGFITTSFSWRWIFYINLPVGGAALVYIISTLHLPAKRVSHRVDYLGGACSAWPPPRSSCWPPGAAPSTAGLRRRSSGWPCSRWRPRSRSAWSSCGWPSRSCRCTCSGTGTSRSRWR